MWSYCSSSILQNHIIFIKDVSTTIVILFSYAIRQGLIERQIIIFSHPASLITNSDGLTVLDGYTIGVGKFPLQSFQCFMIPAEDRQKRVCLTTDNRYIPVSSNRAVSADVKNIDNAVALEFNVNRFFRWYDLIYKNAEVLDLSFFLMRNC